ncbi:MAG: pantoate--beta-alanine ligase [Deltaproteobacteria bacterium]|nr:pantoate--beta-alanine ligase [Deltaproteobacteria bacterium]MBI3296145.1 pantoate--beta-alanine ligase [Deltaproteobacteria bacterium]
MLKLTQPKQVQSKCRDWTTERIGFVPTMGCLHEGHLSLVREAKRTNDRVIVSIFVNPLQFGPKEDLKNYPRPFEEDCALLEKEGVDLLFHPTPEDLYPAGFDTTLKAGRLATHLCGASRPGHFDGVLTVCLKLFTIMQPTIAVFGEKDFQQLTLIRRMVTDLNLPLTIIPAATVREPDGLALSSRNRYLSPKLRARAPQIHQALEAARWQTSVAAALDLVHARLETEFQIDYVAVCEETELAPLPRATPISTIAQPRLFVAAKLGQTRLIDNVSLKQ